MEAKTRMTRQGIRDLNYYGPKRVSAASVDPKQDEGGAIGPTGPAGAPVRRPSDEEKQQPSDGQ
jgi:hypothetical protein